MGKPPPGGSPKNNNTPKSSLTKTSTILCLTPAGFAPPCSPRTLLEDPSGTVKGRMPTPITRGPQLYSHPRMLPRAQATSHPLALMPLISLDPIFSTSGTASSHVLPTRPRRKWPRPARSSGPRHVKTPTGGRSHHVCAPSMGNVMVPKMELAVVVHIPGGLTRCRAKCVRVKHRALKSVERLTSFRLPPRFRKSDVDRRAQRLAPRNPEQNAGRWALPVPKPLPQGSRKASKLSPASPAMGSVRPHRLIAIFAIV